MDLAYLDMPLEVVTSIEDERMSLVVDNNVVLTEV